MAIDPEQYDNEGDRPAPWFENRPDEEEPGEPDDSSTRDRVIMVAATLVILVLVLIPAFQALILERRQDDLPDQAFDRVALQFASAVMLTRSTGQALILADDELRQDIEDVVEYYRNSANLSNQARVQVSVTPCPRDADNAELCYLGRLFDVGSGTLLAIEFGVDEQDGDALVVFVELDQTLV